MAQIQRVAIVGAGAMGGMYAQHFIDHGFEVGFVASGDRAVRLRESGITVNGLPIRAEVFDSARAATPKADLVLVAVKDQQLTTALEDMAGVVGAETIVLSAMNGLDSEERITARHPEAHVLLAVAMAMDAERAGNEIRYRQSGRIVFGEPDGSASEQVAAVREALTRAGLKCEVDSDMRHRLWWKFMANCGVNPASAVLRAPYGAFQVEGDARSLMLALIDEVLLVAQAEGVPLGPQDVAEWSSVLSRQPAGGWTSMAQDVEAGRPTEIDMFAGKVVELGRRHGIATPYNQAVLWILRHGH